MRRGRDGDSPEAAASLPEMLQEILLRLPPQPSSLPRASAVCRRWRALVTDPNFHRQFRVHHQKSPLLGFFEHTYKGIVFIPALDPPDRIPPSRISLGRCNDGVDSLLDCRHGLVLIEDRLRDEIVVCDPITGGQRRVSFPPEFKRGYLTGSVLCAAGNIRGHVHGGCLSGPFKVVVLVFMGITGNQPFAFVYSSESGVWSTIISTASPCEFLDSGHPATLVGNSLYWLSSRDQILEFDLDRQNLAMSEGPPVTNDVLYGYRRIIQAEDGVVGFAVLAHSLFQMCQRNVNCHGIATWMPWKTIEMHRVLGLPPQIEGHAEGKIIIRGYDEDTGVIFVNVYDSFYKVQLKSMQSRKLPNTNASYRYHPFKSFYTPVPPAVCKRWRGLVANPRFLNCFRAHHRKPPLLGFFERSKQGIVFHPILESPDRIPPARFSLGCNREYDLLNCRHGLILLKYCVTWEVVVCDPITGEQCRVAVPPEFKMDYFTGAVLCAAGNQGHVHGGCHSNPFKVVLVSMYREDNQQLACVYSSETREWGNLIANAAPCDISNFGKPATLVGNVLYWLFQSDRIVEFDLDRRNLAVTVGPLLSNGFLHGDCQIIQAEDGVVGFAILAHPRFQMWQRNISCQGVATWVPWKTIQMHNILGLSLQSAGEIRWLMGHDEDNDLMFLYASRNVYSVQLKSMHSEKLYETNRINQIHPFTSFYTPGTVINEGSNGAEMMHDT